MHGAFGRTASPAARESVMPAIQPPPVPPAAPPAVVPPPVPSRRDWFAAVDACVLAGYRSGFVPSLILHIAALLLLALVVIRPDVPRPGAIAIEFGAATEPDLAMIELPAAAAADLDVPDDAAPLPAEPAPLPLEPAEIAAVEPAAFTVEERAAAPDAAALLAGVRGGRGGGGGGIGGEIGRRLKAARAGTGDVQVSIAWSNVNDIDLHVMVEPLDVRAGTSVINFMNRKGIGGGHLDVDRNVQPTTRTPVENVFWGRGRAPFGRYTVAVHHFRDWGGVDPTEVEVVTLVDGKEERFYVVLRPGDPPQVVTSFQRLPKGGSMAAPVATSPPVAYPESRPLSVGGYGPVRAVPMRPLK
jgi:hypothetical protein